MKKVRLDSDIFKGQVPKYTGCESNIYEYNGELIKIFETNNVHILYNKLLKLNILSELDSIDINPEKLIFLNGIFKGYSYKEKKDYSPINSLKIKRSEKIEILKMIKDKLEFYHNLGIIYGDLHQENILYNGKDIIFCDLDNVSINGFMFDKNNKYMEKYLTFIPNIDEKLDNYMLNLLTVSFYQKIEYSFILTYLQIDSMLSYKFNTKKNRQIVQDMVTLKYENFDELLIDNMKKSLIR